MIESRKLEIDIKGTGPKPVFGEPENAPEGLIIGKVRSTGLSPMSQAPRKEVRFPRDVEGRWISRRRIMVFLEPRESGNQLYHRLWCMVRNNTEDDDWAVLDLAREFLGYGIVQQFDGEWTLFVPEEHNFAFLKTVSKYLPEREDIRKALQWLDSVKYVYIKNGPELAAFEQEHEILL